MKKKCKQKKKGQLSLFFSWFVAAVLIVVIAGVIAPMGVEFNTQMFLAGEDILTRANSSISAIQNDDIRNTLLASTDAALASAEYNIETNNNMFQYAWILIIGITTLIVFLVSRQLVEYSGYGGGGFF